MKGSEPRIFALEKENVLIRSGDCVVTVLPQFGGKIASIRVGDLELLQAPLAPIQARTRSMEFDEGDASGWDECLPSVAACRVKTAGGMAEIPDHGDLWRVEWTGPADQGPRSTAQESNRSLTLWAKCFSLPLELERRIELVEAGGRVCLRLGYTLRNTGDYPVPWSWAAHPLFAVEEGDRIVLPDSIRSLSLEGSGGGRLGKAGETMLWPIAKLANGGAVDLSRASAADSGIGDKLFAGPLSASENWCALERFSTGLRVRVTFDAETTPYLGLWICYGGWPEMPGPKQMCVAMEPATAPVDSLAVMGPWSRSLQPQDSFSWTMEVEIEQLER